MTDPQIPLQIRIPASEVKAIKLAALNGNMTVSEYLLLCFHEKTQKTDRELVQRIAAQVGHA